MRQKKKRRNFRTIVVDKKRMLVCALIVIVSALVYFSALTMTMFINAISDPMHTVIGSACIENIMPSFVSNEKQTQLAYIVFCKTLGFDIKNPKTIIHNQISAFKIAALNTQKNNTKIQEQQSLETEKKDEQNEQLYPIVETSAIVGSVSGEGENKKVYINNETSFSVNINELLNEELLIKKGDGPLVLIVHTHTTESYTPSGEKEYSPEDSTRTIDKKYNMVRVGEVIKQGLEKEGISTIHDTTINDYPSYNGSYNKTLGIIDEYLKKYPSIQVVLDVHRDAMTKSNGTKMKVCAEVDGEKSAQVMVLCGSNEGGLKHDNWRENLKLGLRVQRQLSNRYPGLARPLHFVKERYNQHASYGSMILEIGTDGNTLEEALVCAKYTSKAIAKVLNEI